MKNFALILILILCYNQAASQACCSAGTPLSAQMGMEFLNKGEIPFSIAYDHNLLNDQFTESEQLEIDDRSRLSQSFIFRVQYALSNRWALGFSLPYVYRSENIESDISTFNSLSSNGIGDLLFQLNYALLRKGKHNLLLSGGLKAPTGSIEEKNEFGFTLPADLQPGTGSWDFIFGSLYEMNNIWDGNFHFNASGTIRINGSGTRLDGKETYQFGNAFQLITGLTYDFVLSRSTLAPALNISYRRTLIDEKNGSLIPNTGGDWLNIAPSLAYYYRSHLKILASASFPLFRYLEGTQLTTSYRFYIQIQYTLKTIKNELLENF